MEEAEGVEQVHTEPSDPPPGQAAGPPLRGEKREPDQTR